MAFLVRGALRDVLEESLGSEHVMVISKLDKPMLDSNLSSKVGLEDTRVRSILNDLHEKRLVGLRRTKGPKDGWFSYYWSRREDNIKNFVSVYLNERLNRLNSIVNRNTEEVLYSCGCSSVNYAGAIDSNFQCGICGQTYTNYKTPKDIKGINAEIKRLVELKTKAKLT